MTEAADLLLTNATVHTLTDPDETAEAVAVRDGRIVRVASEYAVRFLEGVGTRVVDCEGGTVLPGFVDAHTHLENVGRSLVHADLAGTPDREAALARLANRADETAGDEWVLGFGYDESEWEAGGHPTRAELDAVTTDRPVAAVRVDMHTAAVNTPALERVRETARAEHVKTDADGGPTGVVVEDALAPIWDAVAGTPADTRDLLEAARDHAHERGVTAVHDMVRNSHAPRVYRDMAADGDLSLRVRLNYWSDHLDAVVETGLRTNAGDEWVRTGAIKTFTDGSIGGATAKLSAPYADEEGTGQWVVTPEELQDIVDRADEAGLQVTAHAIGDAAIEATLDALATADDPAGARHRVEHVELATDDHVKRFADLGVVASMQPNFHRWARDGGLYDTRLGEDRRRRTNRLGTMADADVRLAFGSDCMPLDPLFGVQQAVTAPEAAQRVDVTAALRAYTSGAAYAGFDEDRMGTVEPGKLADLVVLADSPWDVEPDAIADIDVTMTLVDGAVVHDGR